MANGEYSEQCKECGAFLPFHVRRDCPGARAPAPPSPAAETERCLTCGYPICEHTMALLREGYSLRSEAARLRAERDEARAAIDYAMSEFHAAESALARLRGAVEALAVKWRTAWDRGEMPGTILDCARDVQALLAPSAVGGEGGERT